MRGFSLFTVLLLCLIRQTTFAQEVKQPDIRVTGGFTEDSLRVGDEVFYYLTARYPSHLQVVFPDTSFNFSPFELRRKRYFITETRNEVSYDSAVYHLSTFEVKKVQHLRLPVFSIAAGDSVRIEGRGDSVLLHEVIARLPDSLSSQLPVRPNVAYAPVPRRTNIPLIAMLFAVTTAIAAVSYFVFGENLRRYLTKKQLQRAHLRFLTAYTASLEATNAGYSREKAEDAVNLWKRYMESITERPVTKLTTSELVAVEKDEQLKKHLRNLDAAIYGSNTTVADSMAFLREFAKMRFDALIQKLDNGR